MSSAAAMLNRLREAYHHDEFLAFSSDPAVRAMLVELAKQHSWPDYTVHEGGVSAAIQFLVTASSPRRLVVDLGDSPDPVTAMQMLRDTCAAETVIIALGAVNDVKLFREVCRAGATDYIVKPATKDILAEAMERALRSYEMGGEPDGKEAKLGRLILFVGAKGGIGSSTLAMNSAWLLAHEHNLRVALVDLDLQFGTMALDLDLEPGHGLCEALANPSRIDGLFLKSAMVTESANLSVLASEEPLERPVEINPEAAALLFDQLRRGYSCVVVDLPRANLSVSRDLLGKANDIMVVCDLSLASVRDTLRVLSFVRDAAPVANVSVLANRTTNGKGQISRGDFERGIETRVTYLIPDEPKSAALAANSGKPLPAVAKNSAIVRTLRKITTGIAGPAKSKSKFSFWRKR
ncbi:MAG TPA: AAA family ATPase [Alphaproteobacteria bacterium]|jgi:pilus assembly protein CpaE|nr:AAA family ATPase [Alphaproteobacteria bacterium]